MNEMNRKTQRNKVQGGFTLIELLIVVAIVGILAAIAVPRYQDYVTRTQITEGLSIASGAKIVVSENLQLGKTTGLGDGWNAGTDISDYVESVQITDGIGTKDGASAAIITITYKAPPSPSGNVVIDLYAGLGNASVLNWECDVTASQGISSNALPSECR